MANTDFSVLLKAVLDKSGINSELRQVQDIVNKHSIDIIPELKKASLRNQMKAVSQEIANDFNKTFGTNLTGKDVYKAYANQVKIVERAKKEQYKLNQQLLRQEERLLQLQAKKSNKIVSSVNVGNYDTQLLSYQTQLEKLGLSTEEIKTHMNGVNSAFKELKTSASAENIIPSTVVTNADKLEDEMFKLANIVKQLKLKDSLIADDIKVDNTVVRLNEQLRKNSNYSKSAKAQIKAWIAELEKGNVAEARLKKINSEAKQLHSNMANLGKIGLNPLDKLTKAWEKFGGWSLATGSITAVTSKISDALSELKEIDTLITEISKANDKLTKSQLGDIADSSFDVASKYGRTASDYLSGVQEASRAGYINAEEIAELSTATQGAGDMTADLANQMIIATDKAYKLNGEVSALTKVLDGMNYITNHNAVNMTELSEGMSIVGSTAASFGVDASELASVLGTMVATTKQSGSEVARAFRGILLNIRQVSDEEEGIDAEGLTKYEKACNALGVSLKETKDGVLQLRDPMEVLKELSIEYNKLSEEDLRRTQLLNSVGGKLRSTQLDALLRQWSTYEKMLVEYQDGTGSMAREAEKTANSWQGSFNRLSNTWTDTVENIANSDAIIGAINSFNDLLSVINNTTEALGSFGTIATIGAGIAGANGLGLTNYVTYHSLRVPFYKVA